MVSDRKQRYFRIGVVTCLVLVPVAFTALFVLSHFQIRVRTKKSLVQANPLLRLFSEGGSTEAIESVLNANPESINADCGNGTPLYVACGQGRADVVHYLLTHDADPNLKQPGNNETAIVPAVDARNLDIVKDLLAHGADPGVRDVYGRPLPWLAHEGGWPEGETFLRSWIEGSETRPATRRGT
jgi:hypothetical protein